MGGVHMRKKGGMAAAYFVGLLLLALGTSWMEAADFGMSMVVAPAYVLYRALSPRWAFVTFGMAEYAFQAALLVVMAVVLRRWRWKYLWSFATAVLYGFMLDGCMAVSSGTNRGIGCATASAVISFLGACAFRAVWVATVFARYGTFTSLLWCYPFSWVLTSSLQYGYYFLSRKKAFAKAVETIGG